MTRFKVHTGYTTNGRNYWRRFGSLAEASRFCEDVFRTNGVVLAIVAYKCARHGR